MWVPTLCYSKFFMDPLFNLSNSFMKKVCLPSSCYRGKNLRLCKVKSFAKVSELVLDGFGIHTHAVWLRHHGAALPISFTAPDDPLRLGVYLHICRLFRLETEVTFSQLASSS